MSDDPMTALAEAATQLHEVYTAHVAAGFTEAEAMQIVCAIVTSARGDDA